MVIDTNTISVEQYLQRLKLPFLDLSQPMALLENLHYQHSKHIPFENLDIILCKFPSLTETELFRKIVLDKRGGYCYELNGLFYVLLRQLGYDVIHLCARMIFGKKQISFRSHQVILVSLENQKFLVDVGYRSGLLKPIPLITNTVFEQDSESFRLVQDEQKEYFLQKYILNKWESLYSFTLQPYWPDDFIPHHYYNATSPKSVFTQNCIVSKKTGSGNISLINNRIVRIHLGVQEELPVNSICEYQEILESTFEVFLTAAELLKIDMLYFQ